MKTYNYITKETGEIISKYTGKSLAQHVDKKGYHRVKFKHADGGITHLVHRVIALKFIPNPDNLPQVNHKDGDKSNNCVENLEWVTGKRNVEHSKETGLIPRGNKRPNAKLTDNQVRVMRFLREGNTFTYYELGFMFDISYQSAHRVCTRQTYSHIN